MTAILLKRRLPGKFPFGDWTFWMGPETRPNYNLPQICWLNAQPYS
jgi:hypothetical protein